MNNDFDSDYERQRRENIEAAGDTLLLIVTAVIGIALLWLVWAITT